MKIKTIRSGKLVLAVIVTLLCCTVIQATCADALADDADLVYQLLGEISKARTGENGATDTAVVSESALNAYIADRLRHHKVVAVKKLTLRLLDLDHVSGSVDFDAGQLQLDTLLGDNLTFDVKGIVQNRGRAIRLHVIALTLNGYPVKPQVLEFILGRLAATDGSEANRIGGWYPLPGGIEHIGVSKGILNVSY